MKAYMMPLLAVLAGVLPAAAADTAAKTENPCLRSRLVDGYTKPTDDSLVLTQGNKKWLAEFSTKCTGLRFAEAVGVKSRTTCVTPGDSIRFRETGGLRQSCMISALTYLPKEEKKAEPASN
jgi:hypothetical protein